jgi:isoleucyl-tRNA synthetase
MSQINLPDIEKEIFNQWQNNNIFENTLKYSQNRPVFNFYDGPPFATGSPHYGHLLAATIKDTVCRFQTINGHYVPRLNGWDTHGLPIEQLGEKTLGIKTVDDINKMGIDKFNQTCKSLVLSCVQEWEHIIPRMGRWVDFKNGYKTMDFEFMNATWGVFKAIFDKDLVYRSLTPMPYSTGCGSCLSHFEAKSNYQDTQDPSIVIKFPLTEKSLKYTQLKKHCQEDNIMISFLVWTTTPYSLSGNLGLCVNKKITYCLVKKEKDDTNTEDVIQVSEYYILAKESIKTWEKKDNKFVIVTEIDGEYLVGIEYHPPFNFNNFLKLVNGGGNDKIFTVLEDSYVKVDAGTGIVHLAPGMGEDDFRVCLREGVIDVKNPKTIPCPIDDKGQLTVDPYFGQYVKNADKQIIKDLKVKGFLWDAKTVSHSYPFCYRTDTPLIQKSISAWFIDVHKINDKIIDLNKKINWIPSNVGDARFAQWLSTPRDWSFGRNRFWGTPVPLWTNSDFTEIICVGSTNELEELAGLAKGSINDIHREFIDHIQIPSRTNPGTFLTRINDVFDCWFESGSMPYGKYAVENKYVSSEIYQILTNKNTELRTEFLKYFPAHFIGEGLDQTRGWFYTLLVISTILFEETAYKNVIVNGLILSADPTQTGKWIKMSKRYKNYPNPDEVLVKYGADALRLYLLDSPVTHSEPLKFQEDGIQQKAKFLIQLYNCLQFLDSEIKLVIHNKGTFNFIESNQIYDKWIQGKLKELSDKAIKHYSEFKLYLVVPLLIEFEELFSKWYINLAKSNMKSVDNEASLSTLWKVLYNFAILISPITPFMGDKIYRDLVWQYPLTGINSNLKPKDSVHMELLSDTTQLLTSDTLTTRKVNAMVDVVMSVRGLKAGAGIGVRMKSKELVLKHASQQFLDDVKELENELLTAVRIDKVNYQLLDNNTQTDLIVKVNSSPNLGRQLKKDLMSVLDIIRQTQPSELIGKESINIMGYDISSDAWSIVPKQEVNNDILIDYTSKGLLVQLTKEVITTPLEDQLELMIKKMQKAKKDANLKPYQIADVYLDIVSDSEFYQLIKEEFDNIKERLRSNLYLNDNNKHTKLDEFTKIIQSIKTDLYSYEIWI